MAISHTYDAIAVFGSAYDFKERRFPDHIYLSLDEAARVYQEGRAPGGIAVCGWAALEDLQNGRIPPMAEAHEMKRYLMAKYGVPAQAIYTDDQSTDTTHNFINLREIILGEGWQNIFLPTADGRAERIAFLGQKICFGLCEFSVKGIACDTDFCWEPRVLGNYACTLKDVEWGDLSFDVARWRRLHTAHRTCEFYVPLKQSEPFKNYHPPELMERYLTPPSA